MAEASGLSVQEMYAPHGACFGCGPANPLGLRVASRIEGDELVADFRPARQHEAFPGVLSGGIIGTLLDCHSNWTAAWALMRRSGADRPPCTVTAEYHVRLLRPTPTAEVAKLRARPAEVGDSRAVVEATLSAAGKLCATCRGVFVAVEPGHPAYHRW